MAIVKIAPNTNVKLIGKTLFSASGGGGEPEPSGPIIQTQNFSNVGPGLGSTLTWNKFDSDLGTLTGITFEATGVLSGSYTIDNLDPDVEAEFTSNTTARIRLTPSGASAILGSLIDPLATSPASTQGQLIAPESSQVFTLLGEGANESTFNSNQFANAAYYSAVGGGTFDTRIARPLFFTIASEFNSNTSTLLAGGTITLTYEYIPA
jgi:hypothetical protein